MGGVQDLVPGEVLSSLLQGQAVLGGPLPESGGLVSGGVHQSILRAEEVRTTLGRERHGHEIHFGIVLPHQDTCGKPVL